MKQAFFKESSDKIPQKQETEAIEVASNQLDKIRDTLEIMANNSQNEYNKVAFQVMQQTSDTWQNVLEHKAVEEPAEQSSTVKGP